jgi:outer membrane protein
MTVPNLLLRASADSTTTRRETRPTIQASVPVVRLSTPRTRGIGHPTSRARRKQVRQLAIGAALLAGITQQAVAQKAGDLLIGTGWMHVAPQVSTGPFNSNVTVMGQTRALSDSAKSSSIAASNTIGLTATYFITDNIAGEVVAGLPPKFNISGAGSIAQYGKIGSARMWSPTVLLKYYFGQPTSKLRPFVGLGATYVWFTNAQITNGAFAQNDLRGNTSVSVNRGISPVFNAGLSYNVHKNWFIGASVSFIPMTRTITMNTPNASIPTPRGNAPGSIKSTVRARMNPIVTYVNIAYRF